MVPMHPMDTKISNCAPNNNQPHIADKTIAPDYHEKSRVNMISREEGKINEEDKNVIVI